MTAARRSRSAAACGCQLGSRALRARPMTRSSQQKASDVSWGNRVGALPDEDSDSLKYLVETFCLALGMIQGEERAITTIRGVFELSGFRD
jgi:hypothetical protein